MHYEVTHGSGSTVIYGDSWYVDPDGSLVVYSDGFEHEFPKGAWGALFLVSPLAEADEDPDDPPVMDMGVEMEQALARRYAEVIDELIAEGVYMEARGFEDVTDFDRIDVLRMMYGV